MNRDEALDFIFSTSWQGMKPGLDRIQDLVAKLGHPEQGLDYIHVAGTNGKGSTAAILDAIYTAGGYKPGFFSSPDLSGFNERIRLAGKNIPDEDLCRLTEDLVQAVDQMEDKPSEFELTTGLALDYFADQGARPVILEVGLGGELDSTNVIPPPLAALICHLGLDHTAVLGNTIEEVAQAKAGIIKPGSICLAYPSDPRALAVIQEKCDQEKVPLRVADFDLVTAKSHSLAGQRFDWGELRDLEMPLLGRHQLHNASLALETVMALQDQLPISESAIRQGLARVQWPARFEILRHDPAFILDGAHNPQGAQALAQLLDDYLPGQKFTFLMGIMADKGVDDFLEIVLPYANQVVTVEPDNPRALDPTILAEKIRARGEPAEPAPSVEAGVTACLEAGRPCLALGSFYMAGAIRRLVLAGLEDDGDGEVKDDE